jgi:ATP-dependent DNA helicase RecG
LGYRQHGGVTLEVTDLSQDGDLVEAAHLEALSIAQADPELKRADHRLLADECLMRFGAYFQEVERV